MGVRICFCFPGGSVIKTLPVSAEDVSLIPGLGRSSGEGNGNPLQYSCLGNPMERGARWAVVYGVINKLDTIWRLNNSICFCSSWQLLLICLPWENLYWIPTPTDLSQQASKETQSLVSEYITWNISVLSSGKKKKKKKKTTWFRIFVYVQCGTRNYGGVCHGRGGSLPLWTSPGLCICWRLGWTYSNLQLLIS